MIQKILIINNSLAAMKFIYSIKKSSLKCSFYGLATKEDFTSAYIKYLDDFEVLPSGDMRLNFCNIDLILKAARKFKVDLVWPGWGFLSENSILPKVLHQNRIGFIGPSEKAMLTLGDKYLANVLCVKMGISHIPFLKVNINNEDALKSTNDEIKTNEMPKFSLKQIQNFFTLDETKQEQIMEKLGIKNHIKSLDFNLDKLKDTPTMIDSFLASTPKQKNDINKKTEIDHFLMSKDFIDFMEKNEFPLLIKLSLSGGGKGIRIVKDQAELKSVYETVKAEGCGEIILCKIVDNARHIELQMARDKRGNVVCLGGRDCTIQRRHQKLLEESLIIDVDIYEEIVKCGEKLMDAVDYEGIATVEFLLSGKKYFFLEVNTRIQVEHPVTELESNINIPEIQVIIANGGSIKDIKKRKVKKHVLAVRIVSEDPWNGFLPVSGHYQVSYINQPEIFACFTSNNGIIGKHTDSQFGHIFAIAKERKKCVKLMIRFLSNLCIDGITTNVPFMIDLLRTSFFRKRQYTIKTIEMIMNTFMQGGTKDLNLLYNLSSNSKCSINFNDSLTFHQKEESVNNKRIHPVILFAVLHTLDNNLRFQELEFIYESVIYEIKVYCFSENAMILESNDTFIMVNYIQFEDKWFISAQDLTELANLKTNGDIFCINHKTGTHKFTFSTNKKNILAPTDGKIIKYFLKNGDYVEKGQNFVEIEIMKMRLCVSSPYSGVLILSANVDSFIKENDVIGLIENDTKCLFKRSDLVFTHSNNLSIPEDNSLIEFKGILINYLSLINVFKGYSFPKEVYNIISETININPNILLTYITEFYHNRNILNKSEIFIHSVLISINHFFELNNNDYALDRSLLELLELIDSIIIEMDLVEMVYDQFVILKRKLAEYKFKKVNFFYNHEATESSLMEYIKKNCCYKEGILFSLSCVRSNHNELIRKYLFDTIGNIYQNFIIETNDFRKFSFSYNSKNISGLFNICNSNNCSEFTFSEDLVLHYNCTNKKIGNHFYIATNVTTPYITYVFNNQDYQSDEIIHSFIHGTVYEESNLMYQDIFRNLSIHKKDQGLEIIYKIDTHSQNSIMNVKDLSHAIKEILCAIIITRKKVILAKGIFKIFVIGEIQIPSEYVLRIIDDCMFYHSHHFIKNGIIQCDVVYKSHTENKIIHRIIRGFMEKLVYVDGILVEYKIDNEVIFSSGKEKIANFVHAQLPNENKNREIARNNNTIVVDDLLYLFSVLFINNNYSFSLNEIFLEETTPLNNDINDSYSYNNKTYFLSKNHRKIGIRGFLINYNGNQFFMVVNDISYKNGSFSVHEYIFYTLMIRNAIKQGCPFLFISCNSGAKIGLYDKLKSEVKFENNHFYHENSDDGVIKKDGIIISIHGNEDSGPENLSFSGLLASETVVAYEKILTLSYVTGRSVGIGAYLNKLGERIIQRKDSSILLTGFQALNKLLQSKVYTSNTEIGGVSVMDYNGNNHLTVDNDFLGVKEVLRWLDYHFTSGTRIKKGEKISLSETKKERLNNFLEKYDSIEFSETYNEREILEVVIDRNTLQEYKIHYGSNIIIGRGKINGLSIGIISTESDSNRNGKSMTKHVLFPDSSDKVAQSIRDFSNESLNILIIANFKGFAGGKKEMEDNILKHGSEIVRSLHHCKTKVLLYVPPFGQVRGGSWVVFDKNINQNIQIYAHPSSEVGIMQPDGICELKFKEKERINVFNRMNQSYTPENGYRMGVEFCKLHDGIARMYINNMVDKIVCVKELRSMIFDYFTQIKD